MLCGFILFSLLFSAGESDTLPAPPGVDPIQHLTNIVNQMSVSVSQQIGNLTNSVQSLSQKVETLERNVLDNENHIAFSARLTHSLTLGDRQAVVFNDVITNEGNGYNKNDGEFTAPMVGIYHFTGSIMGFDGEKIHIYMVKNGVPLVSLYGAADSGTMGTHSVVVNMNAGDKIWLRNHGTAGQHLYSTTSSFYCAFSGFKL